MKEPPQTPWPSIIKVALIIGCTGAFCILGLIAGILGAKAAAGADMRSGEILVTVLMPPAVGAIFGFVVGLVSTAFVRWSPRYPVDKPPTVGSGKD